ncbi:MAG: family 20 glycosylhydrolase [Phycisphaerae bacterium]|nr:family 20 glycosylhydrolase [Phycisphaerae bacterium]
MGKLLIPPQKFSRQAGFFRWPDTAVLATSNTADILPLNELARELRQIGVKAIVSLNAYSPAGLRLSRSIKGQPESYKITITKDGIKIISHTDAGTYYAIGTLIDLVKINGWRLASCIIEDWPDFGRRGVYLDVSRGKVPKIETIKELVQRLAHWKINELQLYIENVFTFIRHPKIGKGYDPFTPQDILDIQDYCKARHIRMVGSLASFGHMEKILALNEYCHLGELPGFNGWRGGTTLFPADPKSIKLVGELYEEFVPLFKAEDFNICGDEPWELGKGRSKAWVQRIGAGQVYLSYFKKLCDLCRKYGKRPNAWADIVLQYPQILSDIPKDVVMLNWDYNVDGERMRRTGEIAKAGLDFMVCPGTSGWNTHGTRLENAIGNVSQFAAQGRKYNAQGLLNTDWGDNGHRNMLGVSLHGFAHGAAHSWNGRAVDDKIFTEDFCAVEFGKDVSRPLAKALKLLGSTYKLCGAPYRNESALFHALVEPIGHKAKNDPEAPDYPANRSRIDSTIEKGLIEIIEKLSQTSWPVSSGQVPEFDKLAIKEFRLAAKMDITAAFRALAAKDVRSGKKVAAKDFRRIADDMAKISKEFELLWLSRNKPSRLKDNLKLFKRIENESRSLAVRK